MNKVLLVVVIMMFCSSAQAAPMIGQEGRISFKMAAACVSKNAHDLWVKAEVAKDDVGMMGLLFTGECFFVEKGDKVLVIDKSWTVTKIRVRSGEAKGKAGWVYMEAVQ